MKQFILSHKLESIGAGVGALAGFLYWYFVGCASGNCAIASNPYISSLYGGVLGYLLFGLFDNKKTKDKNYENS